MVYLYESLLDWHEQLADYQDEFEDLINEGIEVQAGQRVVWLHFAALAARYLVALRPW